MTIQLGKVVPNFSALSNAGEFELQNYRGSYVVIYFYPKDNTPGCTCEANDFTDFVSEFAKLNAKIIGVSRDTMQSHAKFVEKRAIKFPLLADTDSKVCNLFGVVNEKSLFGKTALGIVRSTFIIDPNGKLVKEWRKVKVANHVQEVLEALKQLVSDQ